MGKINNRKSFIIIGAVILCIIIACLISLYLREKPVIAYITPTDIGKQSLIPLSILSCHLLSLPHNKSITYETKELNFRCL